MYNEHESDLSSLNCGRFVTHTCKLLWMNQQHTYFVERKKGERMREKCDHYDNILFDQMLARPSPLLSTSPKANLCQ